MNGQMLGWAHLKAVHSQVVRKSLKPSCKCVKCGRDLYFITINLKHGPVRIAFEDGFHGSKDDKVLYNHEHMTQTRCSCFYTEVGHDVVTGKKFMTTDEETELRDELKTRLEMCDMKEIPEVLKYSNAKRILEIGDELRKAGKEI
jgi:predicted amidophosphoribosyltransferase